MGAVRPADPGGQAMNGTPAADLARLRQAYGARWRIDRQPGSIQETGSGPSGGAPALFVAVNRTTGATLTDQSAAGLAAKIQRAEAGR
jgi:hypothetical protein